MPFCHKQSAFEKLKNCCASPKISVPEYPDKTYKGHAVRQGEQCKVDKLNQRPEGTVGIQCRFICFTKFHSETINARTLHQRHGCQEDGNDSGSTNDSIHCLETANYQHINTCCQYTVYTNRKDLPHVLQSASPRF
jgi:hypothetical protein